MVRDTPKLRAALQCRVSTRSGDSRERSVEEQEQAGRQTIQEMGWTLNEQYVYPEPPGSASRFASRIRNLWLQLIADLDAGAWDVLVIWEVDRASRELETWAKFLNLARRRRVLIHVITHRRTYDITVRRDWKSLAEDGVDAADYSEKLSDNVTRAMRANVAAGRPHGKVAYGYRRTHDPATGRLVGQVIFEPKAAVIRRAAEDVLAGRSLSSIVADLNAANTPPPRGERWARSTLRRILTNPAYIARRTHHGVVAGPGDWEPILTEATWYAVQAALAAHTPPARDATVRWLLSGIACCGLCGTGLRVVRSGNRAYGYRAYRCPACHKVGREVGWLDGYVTEVVLTILEDPRLAALLAEPDTGALAQAVQREETLRAQLDQTRAEVVALRMTPAMAAQIEAELLPQLEAAGEARQRLSVPSPARGVAGPDARRLWPGLATEQQRAVIRALVQVRVLPTGKGRRNDHTRIEVTARHPVG